MSTFAADSRSVHRTFLSGAVLALGLGFAPPAFPAAETADGEFSNRDFKMAVGGAVAFRGKSLMDQKDVIVVAVSNGPFDAPWLANFVDRKRVIEKRVKGADAPIVYVEFLPDGSYRGHSFYFKSGNGCGYCGGNMGVTSTVKVAGGKLNGTLKIRDTGKSGDIKLIDVPILSDDHGAPLPAGGGDPGKAYMAYHDAMVTNDPVKLRPHLTKTNGKYVDDALKRNKGRQIMKVFADEHPTKSVKITRGWSKGDVAVLLFEGETPILNLTGEAVLLREGGKWLVEEELSDVVMR